MKLLEPLHSFGAVTAAQHLLGLATGVLVYWAAARHTRRWIATLAAAPRAGGAVPDRAGAPARLRHAVHVPGRRRRRARARRTAQGGHDRAAAGRRLAHQDRRAAVDRGAGGLVLAAPSDQAGLDHAGGRGGPDPRVRGGWFYATYQRVGVIGANGVFLYARTMSFADCAEMDPPPDLRVLCDPRPA
ncbi:hypothetical protein ACFSTC_49390 [Nonomuraea ferruginea]